MGKGGSEMKLFGESVALSCGLYGWGTGKQMLLPEEIDVLGLVGAEGLGLGTVGLIAGEIGLKRTCCGELEPAPPDDLLCKGWDPEGMKGGRGTERGYNGCEERSVGSIGILWMCERVSE